MMIFHPVKNLKKPEIISVSFAFAKIKMRLNFERQTKMHFVIRIISRL